MNIQPKLLLVGLGNPGKKYAFTRHNAGRLLVRYLRDHPIAGIELIESNEYMNNSGKFVAALVQKTLKTHRARGSVLSFPNLILAHDDLDLPLGRVKLQFGRGPRVHGGVASVEAALATTEFWRLRIGIDNRRPEASDMYIGKDYVLSVFNKEEKKLLDQSFIQATKLLEELIRCNV